MTWLSFPSRVAESMVEDGRGGEEEQEQKERRGKAGEKPPQSPLFSMTTEKFAAALTSEDAVSGNRMCLVTVMEWHFNMCLYIFEYYHYVVKAFEGW